MLSIFDGLRDVTLLSMTLRLVLAVICGGAIGLEREFKRRSAGFRTHTLICLGASITTLISQYLYLHMGLFTDMARLGAQVVAGIGFIGAGAFMTTPRHKVKGLTTAAGLWASAIVGLCLGAGFYEGGILATGLILLAELAFSKFEYRVLSYKQDINLYVEYTGKEGLGNVMMLFRELELKVVNMEVTRSKETAHHNACAIFNLQLNKQYTVEQILEAVLAEPGVVQAEEL